ncbi:cytochrome P450 714A1 [Ziziphus jujuba]|uniref:Cytochrome P450 714A1 n=1 Tax=Ziziphus jujuba TaxID=326968 RepID=A0A6P3ZDY5_ZIZJJ|nr:cytochrome P450 714A1 [Ziziphus jujuba]
MLLAINPEWQTRAREEVQEICQGQMPDADMIQKKKVLTMVIYESLRLYPPAPLISRESFEDLKFGNINNPKGLNVWTMFLTLHYDQDIWGPDAHDFKPERFANGISGSCKHPHVSLPFGASACICLGQHFAMSELKILLSLLLSNFSFSLSPKYRDSLVLTVTFRPEHGVNLTMRKL